MPNFAEEIFQGFLRREETALKAVYDLYYGPLCYFAEKLVINRQAAEEIVVDVFIKTFRSHPPVTCLDHLRGYLFMAVKNESLNYLKREKRYEKHLQDYLNDIQLRINHAENELIETAAFETTFQIAEGLPGECKRIFYMLYKEQMSYHDIAEQLQLNIQTVRNNINYTNWPMGIHERFIYFLTPEGQYGVMFVRSFSFDHVG